MSQHSQSPWSHESVSLHALRKIMERHRGLSLAIKAKDLVSILGLGHRDSYPERSIRKAVVDLRKQGCPIGSSVKENYEGYFWVVTEDELAMCVRNYEARARAIKAEAQQLIDAFRHGPKQPGLPGLS